MRFLFAFLLSIYSFQLCAQSKELLSESDSILVQRTSPPSLWGGVGGGAPLHILTWNIYMRPNSILWNGQFRRAKAIGQLLKKEHYDIILFQEAFGKGSRKRLRKALEGSYAYEIEPKNNKKTVNSGLWILSKHELKASDFIFFDDCLVSDCQSSKGAVWFEVEVNGQRYQFINTHVQAEDGKEFALVRAKQFSMTTDLLASHQQKDAPQFVLGDLN
ncbi:MAG: endonuclease/exonuclease/phosphatase family protein, partial [Flavobacteriales bacterium]|nr:endonuclease/exonuclease/phosphatase family protein [Flavobacteriales bacterium]